MTVPPTTTTATVRRREQLLSAFDRVAFSLTFLGGAVGIIALKLLSFPQVAVTALPLALMTIYLAYVVTSRRHSQFDEQTGDNIYYLGFLFTLVSIAYSLYEFTIAESAASRIIVNFGIALSTTIFGVLFRIVLMQVRVDPPAVERMARVELSEAAIRLRSEIDLAVQSLSNARKNAEEAMASATADTVKSASLAIAEIAGGFKNLSQAMLKDLSAAHSVHNDSAQAMNKAGAKIVTAAEKLGQRLDGIEVPSDVLERKLDALLQRFSEATNSLNQIAGTARSTTDDLKAVGDSLREQSSAISTATSELRSQTSILTGNNTVGQMVEQWRSLLQLAERHQASLQQATGSLAADLDAMRQQRDEIRTLVSQASQMLVELEGTLVALARTLVEKVNAAR